MTKKAPKKSNVGFDVETLRKIADAPGFLYVPLDVSSALLELGYVEVNATMVDENGNVATRATEKGWGALEEFEPAPEPEPKPFTKPASKLATLDFNRATEFVIETGVPLVQRARRKSECRYPFDLLELDQSFFVPATEEKPNPAKSLASTVSSANARHKENNVYTKKFVVRAVDGGARVWRVL